MPLFAISSKLGPIWGGNVKNPIVFIVLPWPMGHRFGTSASWAQGSHEVACAWEDDQKAYGLHVQAIVIDVGQCINVHRIETRLFLQFVS